MQLPYSTKGKGYIFSGVSFMQNASVILHVLADYINVTWCETIMRQCLALHYWKMLSSDECTQPVTKKSSKASKASTLRGVEEALTCLYDKIYADY